MKWSIMTVGRPALAYAKAGVAEYLKRLQHQTKIEWQVVKELPAVPPRGAGHLIVALDERGAQLTTAQWREAVDAWELRAIKQVTVLIGGSDGHSQKLRQEADVVWGLSPLTLQHELALVVFLEQLYRVYTIKRGEPYHR
jgi:23S rRNA (pseudouridine1915-N3)-methyltransferase